MFKTDRLWNVAAVAALLSLAGAYAAAGIGDPKQTAGFENNPTLELSRDSVLQGDRFLIGDVKLVSPVEADALAVSASSGAPQWSRCLTNGPDWLRESEDGGGLDLVPPWGSAAKDRIITAQCNAGQIRIGGHTLLRGSDESVVKRAMLFLSVPSRDGPVKIVFTKQYAANGMRLTLNEIRAIDPASGRILFSATHEDGTRALAVAPYAALEVTGASLQKTRNGS